MVILLEQHVGQSGEVGQSVKKLAFLEQRFCQPTTRETSRGRDELGGGQVGRTVAGKRHPG